MASKSFSFPDMIDKYSGGFKPIEDKEAVKQNIKLLLSSIRTELLGDPYYGTNLQRLLFDSNDVVLKDQIIDEIYVAIRLFVREATLTRNDIKISQDRKGKVDVNLKITYNKDGTNDLLNIQLISNEEI